MTESSHPSRPRTSRASTVVVIGFLIFAAGLALRLVDLTDPPLGFHAWRQLRSAAIARGIGYSLNEQLGPGLQEKAAALAKFGLLEPPLFEWAAGILYALLGFEALWLARLIGIAAWMAGGIALYVLAREWTSDWGATTATAFFLILPFGVQVSRAFLPDVLMTAWVIVAALFLDRWSQRGGLGWAILAGVSSGIAILTKVFAFFPLVTLATALVLTRTGFARASRDRNSYVVLALAGGIPAVYYFGMRAGSAAGYLSSWVFPFTRLLLQPWFYLRWAVALYRSVGAPSLVLSLAGLVLALPRLRLKLVSLWVGYALFSMTIPSLIISHSYYHTVLIPILALSIAPLGQRAFEFVRGRKTIWKAAAAGIGATLVIWAGYASLQTMLARNYRPEVLGWEKMGRELPDGARLVGLTHDYNARIRYYGWTQVTQWPHATDYEMQVLAGGNFDASDPSIAEPILRRLENYDYFVITLHEELQRQPVLAQVLENEFPMIDGEGYVLYDLRAR